MSHRTTRYFMVMLFVCLSAGKLSACVTDSPAFSASYRGTPDGVGTDGDLDDWGALTIDANDPDCAHAAANRIVAKLSTTPTLYFQQSLAGYNIALIFAAAVRLGSYGWFNTQPDPSNSLTEQLERIKNNYVEKSHAGGCGTGFLGNSCMDDLAGEAAAWGWMAAYKKKHGDSDTWLAAQTSGDRIDAFFNNVCIFSQLKYDNPNDPGYHRLCNGNVADIEYNNAYVFAFEHDKETPHYGFGLLTSIDGAIVGLEAAGAGKTLSGDQQSLVFGMWREIQMHINNWYGQECKVPISLGNGQYGFGTNVSCDDQGYDPSMYNLKAFLINPSHGNFTPPFDQYQAAGGYNWEGVANPFTDHQGFGRRATYNEQAGDWYVHRADAGRYMPFNTHASQGYLDAVSAAGVASGWACDGDAPTGTVKVDFYFGDALVGEDPSQFPNIGSEPAVNNLCGGGSTHRFFVQLPSSARGYPIRAAARDYTTGTTVNLSCVAPSCTWIDNPPAASFTISCAALSCTANGGGSSDDVGISGYQWNWGDMQTGSGSIASHTFAANGTYTVTLTVTDTIGQTNATTHAVTVSDNPPTAAFVIPCTGRTCSANAGASTDDVGISSYQWNFGDTQGGSGLNASHSYAVNGTYTVTLTVTDTIGQTNSITHSVTVTDNPPVASFTISCVNLTCSTNGTASSDDFGIGIYSWSWGDNGAGNTGSTASHTFAAAGTYVVTLTVIDTSGQTNSTTRTVTVCTAPAISTQPTASPSTIDAGGSSTLTIVVTGTAPLTVQWYTAGGTGVGSGTSISVSPNTTTTYHAIVTNACGSVVQSANVQVTYCSPGLGTAPSATPSTITSGLSSKLEASGATGTGPLTYLWYKSDGTLVGTSTSKKLQVSPTVTTSYYYKVSNSCGPTTGASPTVTVTVQ
jgi:PKD repeat protein